MVQRCVANASRPDESWRKSLPFQFALPGAVFAGSTGLCWHGKRVSHALARKNRCSGLKNCCNTGPCKNCVCVSQSVCPFVCQSVCLSVRLSVSLSVCPFVCQSVSLSVCQSVIVCVWLCGCECLHVLVQKTRLLRRLFKRSFVVDYGCWETVVICQIDGILLAKP